MFTHIIVLHFCKMSTNLSEYFMLYQISSKFANILHTYLCTLYTTLLSTCLYLSGAAGTAASAVLSLPVSHAIAFLYLILRFFPNIDKVHMQKTRPITFLRLSSYPPHQYYFILLYTIFQYYIACLLY